VIIQALIYVGPAVKTFFVLIAVLSLLSLPRANNGGNAFSDEPTSRPAISGIEGKPDLSNFEVDRLVAWCIVPFDALKRGPSERVEMLKRLGIKRVAYDWREEHVSQFEEEISLYKKHDIEFFAFWSWHPAMETLVQEYGIRPQIWYECPSPKAETREAMIQIAAQSLLPVIETAKRLGLKLALYNHGGWGGKPENMVAVCEYLQMHHQADHVGIVYNFHHAHDATANFESSFRLMMPYLLCLNLNGMVDPAQFDVSKVENKIVTIGTGVNERKMLQAVIANAYRGPVGIIDHRPDLDTEVALKENIDGLKTLLLDMQDTPVSSLRDK
jgi:sugar phosphate isomerase/epimerase